MKRWEGKRIWFWGRGLFVLLVIIWTGILLGGLYRQYHLFEKIEKKCSQKISQIGFSEVTLLQNNGCDMVSPWCERTALLQYIMGQGTDTKSVYQEQESVSLIGVDTVDNPSDEVEDIAVFNNGSFDITENNSSLKEYVQASAASTPAASQVADENSAVSQDRSSSAETTTVSAALKKNLSMVETLQKQKNRSYLLKNFYIVDSSTSIDPKVFQVNKLLSKDVSLKQKKTPQILIYHTHGASEAFADSKAGSKEESIIGVGGELAKVLTEKYGYHVIHDETEYDRINGSIDRNKAYNQSYAGVSNTLQKYPDIQVVIDLHRDGVGNKVRRLTTINGKKTAQVMFFNGLSRNQNGDITYLHNDNLQANLAFSLQMKIACMENYPDFAKPIYLKSYRYNLQLRERSLLIELGNENNTLQEAKNAMEPLAKMLHQVLSKS